MEIVTRHVTDAPCCDGAGCEECRVTMYRCVCGAEWPVGGGMPWHKDGCTSAATIPAERMGGVSARLIDANAAKKLLEDTTPGPWRAREGHTYGVGPTVIIESVPADIDVAIVIETDDPIDAADARLCAAAPDLAASVVSLEERVAGLVVEAERLRHERTEARAEVGRLTDDVDHLNTVYAASSAHVEEMVEALAEARAAIGKFLGVIDRLASSDDTGHAARAEYTEALEELRLAGGGAR